MGSSERDRGSCSKANCRIELLPFRDGITWVPTVTWGRATYGTEAQMMPIVNIVPLVEVSEAWFLHNQWSNVKQEFSKGGAPILVFSMLLCSRIYLVPNTLPIRRGWTTKYMIQKGGGGGWTQPLPTWSGSNSGSIKQEKWKLAGRVGVEEADSIVYQSFLFQLKFCRRCILLRKQRHTILMIVRMALMNWAATHQVRTHSF